MLSGHSSLLAQLSSAGNLFYTATNVHALVVDLTHRNLIEIPSNCLKNCICKKLEILLGINTNLDHVYKNCTISMNVNRQLIYKCPFGLVNIISPVMIDNQVVAALLGGPIVSKTPEDFFSTELSSQVILNAEARLLLKKEAENYPTLDTNQIIALSEVLVSLISHCQTDHTATPLAQDPAAVISAKNSDDMCSSLISSVIDFVSSNYADDITLNDAAKFAYVNPSHLSRVFNNEMNCHFRSFLNSMRIKHSKDLLLNRPELSIADISTTVGFESQSYFNKIFKKYENMTPSEYRRLNPRMPLGITK